MARTVVYPVSNLREGPPRGPDGFAAKIAKYVPAEMIAIATIFFAVFTIHGWTVWVWIGLGALLNVVYLWTVSRPEDVPAPRLYFYGLSIVAFILWSMATIDAVAIEAGLGGDTNEGQRAFMLAFAAFLVPSLDVAISRLPRKASTPPASPSTPAAV